jgi:hypothetical protein
LQVKNTAKKVQQTEQEDISYLKCDDIFEIGKTVGRFQINVFPEGSVNVLEQKGDLLR